jgi:hypothetical protein
MASDEIIPEKSGSTSSQGVPEGSAFDVDAAAAAAVKAVKAGKSKDVDIAAQIIAQYADSGDREWTAEEEKKLIRKVDWMIVPIVSGWPRTSPTPLVTGTNMKSSSLFAPLCPVLTRLPSRLLPSTASERI